MTQYKFKMQTKMNGRGSIMLLLTSSFSFLSCNSEDESVVEGCGVKNIIKEASTNDAQYATFEITDYFGEQKDEVVEAIREGRVVSIGSYGATLEAQTNWPPPDYDLGMALGVPSDESCPFKVYLSGSSQNYIHVVTVTGTVADILYATGSDSRCTIYFQGDNAFFRYVSGDSYYDENYLFIRLGADPVSYGNGYETTYETAPIDLSTLSVGYTNNLLNTWP